MDEIFGLDLLKKERVEVPKEVLELAKEREKARAKKDWKKADMLREKVKKLGFWINDTAEGQKIAKL
jgi:cysteinyl-tRNA synthetase